MVLAGNPNADDLEPLALLGWLSWSIISKNTCAKKSSEEYKDLRQPWGLNSCLAHPFGVLYQFLLNVVSAGIVYTI
jgi:hypothetical protein